MEAAEWMKHGQLLRALNARGHGVVQRLLSKGKLERRKNPNTHQWEYNPLSVAAIIAERAGRAKGETSEPVAEPAASASSASSTKPDDNDDDESKWLSASAAANYVGSRSTSIFNWYMKSQPGRIRRKKISRHGGPSYWCYHRDDLEAIRRERMAKGNFHSPYRERKKRGEPKQSKRQLALAKVNAELQKQRSMTIHDRIVEFARATIQDVPHLHAIKIERVDATHIRVEYEQRQLTTKAYSLDVDGGE